MGGRSPLAAAIIPIHGGCRGQRVSRQTGPGPASPLRPAPTRPVDPTSGVRWKDPAPRHRGAGRKPARASGLSTSRIDPPRSTAKSPVPAPPSYGPPPCARCPASPHHVRGHAPARMPYGQRGPCHRDVPPSRPTAGPAPPGRSRTPPSPTGRHVRHPGFGFRRPHGHCVGEPAQRRVSVRKQMRQHRRTAAQQEVGGQLRTLAVCPHALRQTFAAKPLHLLELIDQHHDAAAAAAKRSGRDNASSSHSLAVRSGQRHRSERAMAVGQDRRRQLHGEFFGRGASQQVDTYREHARLPTINRRGTSAAAIVFPVRRGAGTMTLDPRRSRRSIVSKAACRLRHLPPPAEPRKERAHTPPP